MAGEKDEKFDEKEAEKREEKSPEEKRWEEKYRRDPLGPIIWGLILVWAGAVFLAANLGMLDSLFGVREGPPWLRALSGGWSLVFLGAGAFLLLEVLIRLLIPAYRQPVAGQLILAIVFIAIALGELVSWNILFPLILITIGLVFLLRGVFKRR